MTLEQALVVFKFSKADIFDEPKALTRRLSAAFVWSIGNSNRVFIVRLKHVLIIIGKALI